ncbi:MAG: helix-turn-helix domain-containing protein [Enterocloster sp.]
MNSYTDLDMIHDFLKKTAGVDIHYIKNSSSALQQYDCILAGSMKKGELIPEILKEHRIYHICDAFSLSYTITCHKNREYPLTIIGPFLKSEPNDSFLISVMSQNRMHPNVKKQLRDYYEHIPVVNASLVCYLAGVIANYFHGAEMDLSIVPLDYTSVISGIGDPFYSDSENSTLINNFNNEFPNKELIHHFVRHGNLKNAVAAYDSVVRSLEVHNPDMKLNQAQKYSYSLNAICHHAAYEGGVPIAVLDFISEKNLKEIDSSASVSALREINNRALFEYATIVRYLHLKHYSRPVQRVIEYIFINLNRELTLTELAASIKVSPSYLSALFKKETGRSPIAFVIEKKIFYACQLLRETPMSVQEIAQYLGYRDTSYFSRVFRKIKHVTPQAYRKDPANK